MKLLKQPLFPTLLFASCLSFSQQIKFNRIMPPTGGFSGFVGGVAQDKYGYMWFATRAGLFKYDGYRFKVYSSSSSDSNSLSDNRLETVFADSKGLIWIATWINGLDRLDPVTGKFKHFKHDANDLGSLSNDTVRSILEDRDGTVWIGTSGGLDKYDLRSEKFQHYSHHSNDPSSLSCNRVRIIYEDKRGTMWVGTGSVWEGGETDEGGLNRFDKHTGKFTRYLHDPGDPHSLINNKVNAILEDSKGNFWVGTAGDGLHTMDRATGRFERHQYDPAHPEKLSRPPLNYGTNFGLDNITFINEDAVHNIWIGTLSNGINEYDPQKRKIAHYGGKDNTNGFTGYSGWCFGNSADGNSWIGTYEGGLYRVDPFRNDIDHLFTSSPVWAFNEDPASGFFIGTKNGLIFQSKKTATSNAFPLRHKNGGSLSDNINSLFRDIEGTLWVGSGNGLRKFNPRSNNLTAYVNDPKDTTSISAGGVFAVKDKDLDSLWIGTENGLDLMSKSNGKFIHFKKNASDSNSSDGNFVVALLVEKTGDLWVAHRNGGGLDLFDHITRRFRQFLKGTNLSSLVRDSSGTLWVGTDDGLYETKGHADGFKKFIAPAGSMDMREVLWMQKDDQDKIWLSCNSGIVRMDPFTNQITVYGSNYDIDPGLLTPISGYKGLDGKIYFGALTGYYVFTPGKFMYNSKPPQVVITDFSIGGKSIGPGPKGVLNSSIEDSKEIHLRYNQNIFSFAFAGIHYSDPSNNQHLYMLENYDQAWREAGSARIASYYNVPPGHYVFHVKASNNDGVWAERSIVVIISPPWWRTWGAYCIYALLFIMLAYTVHRYQKARVIKAERERTRAREMAQAREIEKAYHELKTTQSQLVQQEKMASLGELTAGVAHEIQNPLNFVNNFSEVNSELITEMKNEIDKGNFSEVRSIAKNIDDNEQKIMFHGKRADAIVKSMLQHSRTSSGQKESMDVNALADEYLRLAYHGLRAKDKSFNAEIKSDLDPSIGKINIIPQDIGRALLNLFNNSFYAVNEKAKEQINGYEPTIAVSTRKVKDMIELTVKDNGNGIPQKILDKIFQPFFTTKPTGQGTGLGLSLSYDIIKAHGGEIKVKTKEGEGSEFIIQLPIV